MEAIALVVLVVMSICTLVFVDKYSIEIIDTVLGLCFALVALVVFVFLLVFSPIRTINGIRGKE